MNVFETLNNPSMLHAALVHFPIVLSALGLLVVALLAYFHDKMHYRWLAITIYGMCVLSGWVAEKSGESAMAMVSNRLTQDIWDLIYDHQAMGERVYIMAGVTLIFLFISLLEHDGVRKIMTLFSLAASLATFGLVSITAHYGGVLVYQHGVGTPMSHVGYEGLRTPESEGDIAIHEIDLDEARQVSFQRDVWPIFDRHCLSCHEMPDPDGAYAMETVELMMQAGAKGGPGIVPGKPDESSIVLYIRGVMQPRMPRNKSPLSEEQLHIIRSWITAGALDDSGAPPEPNEQPIQQPEESPIFDPLSDTGESTLPDNPTTEEPPAAFDPFASPPETEAAPEVFDPFAGEDTQSSEVLDNEHEKEETTEQLEQESLDPFDSENIEKNEGELSDEHFEIHEDFRELETDSPPNTQDEGDELNPDSTPKDPPAPVRPPRRNPLFDPFSA